MVVITAAPTPTRIRILPIVALLTTLVEASLCSEIAILALTCIYLYLHKQSVIVVFAFLLIALDRRVQGCLRRGLSSGIPVELHNQNLTW